MALHSFNNESKHLLCTRDAMPVWENRCRQGKDMYLGKKMEQEIGVKGSGMEEREPGDDVEKRKKRREDTVPSRQ